MCELIFILIFLITMVVCSRRGEQRQRGRADETTREARALWRGCSGNTKPRQNASLLNKKRICIYLKFIDKEYL